MVISVGYLKAGDLNYVRDDIEEVYRSCGEAKLKVIIETSRLNDEEIRRVCMTGIRIIKDVTHRTLIIALYCIIN
jgi:deoxyribose-phosphate aldolase